MQDNIRHLKHQKVLMPFFARLCAFVLLFLITSLLFINDDKTKYSIDLGIAFINIFAVINAFYLCKKKLFPWAPLVSGIAVICFSFILNSLIFLGFPISIEIPFWLEIIGVLLIAIFSANLLYMIEKQYSLKGISIDFILIALSTCCLVLIVYPGLLTTITKEFNSYEKSLVFNVFLGIVFLALIFMGLILSKNTQRRYFLLGSMVLSLTIHFFLVAYISFFYQGNSDLLNRISWFFYQLPGVISIFYIFSAEYTYNFRPDKAKKMGLNFLWIATITSVLIIPFGIVTRWFFDLPSIDSLTIALIGGVLSVLVINRIVILISNYEKQRQKLKNMAFTDSLTGILNYLGLQSNISNLNNIFVMNINIEDFKSINDMYDRKFGDEVLRSLARRIVQAQGVLHAARTTGDNFLAVMQVEEKDIYQTFTTFQKEIGLWDTVFNRRVAVPLTFGGSHSTEPEYIDILVSNAEQALKQSRLEKQQFTLYKTPIHSASKKTELPRHELREILQKAIDDDFLPIHFQPIYKTRKGDLKALEMLIRVDSFKHGLLMPGQFIEQAKSYGLLTELTYVCVNMIAREFHRLPEVIININIPPYMLDNNDTLNSFITFFNSKELPTNRFCIEVTEDGDIQTDRLIPAINLLKKEGFSVAMDDFGTGYSSLGRLSSLPFDTVKIDRSLLLAADNGNKTILESAITLVRRLGVSVVVEGVETLEQLALVRELGADSIQGFLFSKPVPFTKHHQFPMNASEIISNF